MVGWIIAAVVIAALFFVLPPILEHMPRAKGGGGLGPALSQLNAIFNPGERYVIEARKELPAERKDDEPKDPEADQT